MKPSFDAWLVDVKEFMTNQGWTLFFSDYDVMLGLRADYNNGRCAHDAAQDLIDEASESLQAR